MRKKLIALSLLVAVSLVSIAITVSAADPAGFNPVKGFEFLASKNENGKYENVVSTALTAAAFKDAGATAYANQALEWIKNQEDDANHCFPKGSCRIKDTAFALWVLNEFGENTASGQEWLRSALVPALKNNWYLQIVTTNSGACRISYPGDSGRGEDVVQVEAGAFPDCAVAASNTFFDLNKCLTKKDIIATSSSVDFDINCADLGPSSIISIIFNSQNTYTLVQQATVDRYQAVINNGCFPESKAENSCSKDASLAANWILARLAAAMNVDIWLKTMYDPLKPLDNAIFSLAAKDNQQTYTSVLIKQQRNDGSFDNDIYTTTFAILALKKGGNTQELNSAIEWLKTKQQSDGSWGNIQNTALALYTSFTNIPVTLPPPGTNYNPTNDCGDGVCNRDETSLSCPQDCQTTTTNCNENNICEVSKGEDSDTCSADCYCGDAVCDSYERSTNSCSQDCNTQTPAGFCGNDIVDAGEECDGADDSACPGACTLSCACEQKSGSGLGKVFLVLFIFVLLGAAVFFYIYGKGKKGGKAKKNVGQEFKPFTSQLEKSQPAQQTQKWNFSSAMSSAKSKVEDDLDKSLEEAKKLLKKI